MGESRLIRIFVETSAGSTERWRYDEQTLRPWSKHAVPHPYPYPYGFVVDTVAEDGGAVDCYLLTKQPIPAGSLVDGEVVGLLEQLENGEVDHKVLAVLPGEAVELGPSLHRTLGDFIRGLVPPPSPVRMEVGRLLDRGAARAYLAAHPADASLYGERGTEPMTERHRAVAGAAGNNAAWCDAVCRAHGSGGWFDESAWTNPGPVPRLYPNAVTLRPEVPAELILDRLGAAEPCSVKDSFGDLDLGAAGFDTLFTADWIWRPPSAAGIDAPGAPPRPGWERLQDTTVLAAWEAAWMDHGGAAGVLGTRLLLDRSIHVVSPSHPGPTAAGAILTAGAGVIGVTNVFADEGVDPWPGIVAYAHRHLPGQVLAGYETGAALRRAEGVGFGAIGELRVWVRSAG